MKLHEKITFLRKYRNISQEVACIEYWMTRPTLSSRETGRSDLFLNEILTIAKFYWVTTECLMKEDDKIEISMKILI